MKLTPVNLLLWRFCLLTFSGITLGQENGSNVVTVKEGDDAILHCSPSTKESITSKVFDWKKDGQKEVFFYDAGIHYNNGRTGQDEQFKGRVSHFPGELKSGNASIMIQYTTMEDSGVYTCIFPRLQPSQTFHIKLVVIVGPRPTFKDRSGEIKSAAPEPYVKTLNQTEDGMLLQCEVRDAFPKPKLHWQDRDGNILHAEEPKVTVRGGRYDVILQTTVTKTDNYRCVATQEEIKHQIYSETYVPVPESCHGAGVFTGLFAGALILAVVQAVIIGVMCITKRRKKGAARRRSVKTADKIRELVLLPCEASDVSPNPKSHLQNGNGHIPPDNHRFSSDKEKEGACLMTLYQV